MSPRLAIRRLGVLFVAVALVAGCGGAPPAETSAATETTTDIAAIKVSGKAGDKPQLDIPQPFAATKTTRRILTEGKGIAVEVGQRVTIDYLGVNGTDGKEFDTSYGKNQAVFALSEESVIKGMVTGLVGVPVGSQVLIAVPPEDGYGTGGVPDAGIGPTDTLLFVIEVKSSAAVLKRANGKKVEAKPGLPTVALDKDSGEPTITVPKAEAPTELVVQPLIAGSGAKVAKGQTITVHYTGLVWDTGAVFDSSWNGGTPASFEIGVGRVIGGWDKGLVGRRVGDQILLVVPPDDGYGVEGNPGAEIKGTDTLVFVVDILDTAS